MAFCAVIHKYRPELLGCDRLGPSQAAHNLELAFSVAERELSIPRLLEVSELSEVSDRRRTRSGPMSEA